MARYRRMRKGGKHKVKIPLLALGGVAVKALEMRPYLLDANEWEWRVFGIESGNKKFHPEKFVANMTPIIVGVAGSMLASKLGINKRLGKIPYVKL